MQFNSVIFGVFIIIPVILSCKLKIIQYEGNTIGLQCREDCFDGQEEILYDEDLLLFNATGQRVTSLFDEKEISFTFEIDGQLRFEVLQSIEGYYYCSRNASEGLPDPTDYITLLGKSCKCLLYIDLSRIMQLVRQVALYPPAILYK